MATLLAISRAMLASLSVFVFVALGIASPLSRRWNEVEVKHAWGEVPRGWSYHSDAPADYKFDLRIGLKQDKLDELIASLYEVSDPSHERYGNHLSKEEVDRLIAPHPSTTALVTEWLEHHKLPASSQIQNSFLTIPSITVAQAERLLNTKYAIYFHNASNSYVVRTMAYSIPSALFGHVDVITPTTYFGTLKSMRVTSFLQPEIKPISGEAKQSLTAAAVPSSCASTITPACLRALYNTTSYVPAATSSNKLGVAGYLNEYANRNDLQTFFKKFRTDAVGGTYTTVLVNGGKDDQSDPGVEANLDIQYTEAISYPTPNIYYSTGGSPPFIPDAATPTNTNEPYLDWLNYVLNQTTVPQVFTTSYGDDEQTVPRDYAIKVCDLFAQLGARGSSVFFSSGDYGVGAGTCATNDGTNRKIFQPAFPASCPYVTAVGGTTKVNPEVAVSFSGGGFSNYFARPSYQSSTVAAYLTKIGTINSGLYNSTGRAYPDLAAQGTGFQVVVGGVTYSVGGTSASSPTVAGIVSLLNDYRISRGKSSLGFLNPLLYSTAFSGFNDITSGSNPGCGTNGFAAIAGWDPVTGFGTPDFVKLQALVG